MRILDAVEKFVCKYANLMVLSVILIIPLSSWVVGVEKAETSAARYVYHIGFFSQWLTIYSSEPDKSVWSLLFNGNDGVSIWITGLFLSFICIFASLVICLKISKYSVKCIKHIKKKSASSRYSDY